MKIHKLFVIPLIALFLVGCESEKEIDELVKEYASDELGLKDIKIIYSEKKNEGNMGDRSYVLRTEKYPILEFSVYLEGLMNTKIVGDDYTAQLDAFKVGETFITKHQEQLYEIDLYDMYFEDPNSDSKLKVTVDASMELSLNEPESIDKLFSLVSLLNEENEVIKNDYYTIQTLYSNYSAITGNESIVLQNLTDIQTIEDLKAVLMKDLDLVNQALIDINFRAIKQLEGELESVGYQFSVGISDESIECEPSFLSELSCNGYKIRIEGKDKSEEKLNELQELLTKQEIPISRVTVPNKGGAIEIIFD